MRILSLVVLFMSNDGDLKSEDKQTSQSFIALNTPWTMPSCWQTANFLTVMTVTSASVTIAQSPFSRIILEHTKSGKFIPSDMGGGRFAIAKCLYAGLASSLTASTLRAGYVTGAKRTSGNLAVEPAIADETTQNEQKQSSNLFTQFGGVAIFSLGDVAFTNTHESLDYLKKLRIVGDNFKPYSIHNLFKLASTGFITRFSGGLINYSALCIGENYFFQLLPAGIENHFVTGAISGMVAGIFSFPFSYCRDAVLSQSTEVDGKLMTPTGFFNTIAGAIKYTQINGATNALTYAAQLICKQVPFRMLRTGSTFAIVAGITDITGDQPLSYFFNTTKPLGAEMQSTVKASASAARQQYGLFPRAGTKDTQQNTAELASNPGLDAKPQ